MKNQGIRLMPDGHCELPTQQPLVKAHPLPNTKHVDISEDEIDPRGIHHVVIPYSQLASATNRFYDWPPEPEFAHVKYNPPVSKSSSVFGSLVADTFAAKASAGSTAQVATATTMARRSTMQGLKPALRRSYSSDIETRSERQLIRPRARTIDIFDFDDSKLKSD